MKKVLFVTYYWPPAGGAPINRILKFYKFLPEFGWEPVILTVDKGDFPFIDHSLVNQIRPDSHVYKAKNISVHSIFKRLTKSSAKEFIPYGFTDHSSNNLKSKISKWVKYNFIPDTRILWKWGAIRKAKQIMNEHTIDLIFSSSPPQTNHIIAKYLARQYNIPWVADFRDPWTDVFWLNNNTRRLSLLHALDKRMERKTIAAMNAITTVSPGLVQLLSQKTNKPIELIYNGFDDEMFMNLPDVKSDEKFTITYAGSMSYEQKPVGFFKALENFFTEKKLKSQVRIRFIGNFPPFLHDMIHQSSFSEIVENIPYTDHQKAIELIVQSDLLLLIVPDTPDNTGVVTSKLFDYMAAGRPILAYGPVESDAAHLIRQSEIGQMFDYDDVEGSCNFIRFHFKRKIDGNNNFQYNKDFVSEFSRRKLTAKLASVFDNLIQL